MDRILDQLQTIVESAGAQDESRPLAPRDTTIHRFRRAKFGLTTPESTSSSTVSSVLYPDSESKFTRMNHDGRQDRHGSRDPGSAPTIAQSSQIVLPHVKHGIDDSITGSGDPNIHCGLCLSNTAETCPGHSLDLKFGIPIVKPESKLLEKCDLNVQRRCPTCAQDVIPASLARQLNHDPVVLLQLCQSIRYCGELHDRFLSTSTPSVSASTSTTQTSVTSRSIAPLDDTTTTDSEDHGTDDDDDDEATTPVAATMPADADDSDDADGETNEEDVVIADADDEQVDEDDEVDLPGDDLNGEGDDGDDEVLADIDPGEDNVTEDIDGEDDFDSKELNDPDGAVEDPEDADNDHGNEEEEDDDDGGDGEAFGSKKSSRRMAARPRSKKTIRALFARIAVTTTPSTTRSKTARAATTPTTEAAIASREKRLDGNVKKAAMLDLIRSQLYATSARPERENDGEENDQPMSPTSPASPNHPVSSTRPPTRTQSMDVDKEHDDDRNERWTPTPGDPYSLLECSPTDQLKRYSAGRGCGAALPALRLHQLEWFATYYIPWTGDPSKSQWATKYTFHPFIVYDMLQRASLSSNPSGSKTSPLTGLMMTSIPTPPPSKRMTDSGSKPSSASNATIHLSKITTLRNLMFQQLEHAGVTTKSFTSVEPVIDISKLSSGSRTIVWVKSPDPTATCNHKAWMRCLPGECDAAGRLVVCTCDHPELCVCILKSLPNDSPIRARYESVIEKAEQESTPAIIVRTPTGRISKQHRPRTYWHYYRLMCEQIILYTVGELTTKRLSRSPLVILPPGVQEDTREASSWSATNTSCNRQLKLMQSVEGTHTGKRGRMRGLITKRCNQTERAVNIPTGHVRLNTFDLPLSAARKLTTSVPTTPWNHALITDWIRSKKVTTVSWRDRSTETYKLKYMDANRFVPILDLIYQRQILDGDRGHSNRMPTLLPQGILGNFTRIVLRNTNGLAVMVMKIKGADCDGDEINLWMSTSPETSAEHESIINAELQARSHQGSGLVINLDQNALKAAFLITQPNMLFTRAQCLSILQCIPMDYMKVTSDMACSTTTKTLLNSIAYPLQSRSLPEPALWFPHERWTGHQLLSMFLPSNYSHGVYPSPSPSSSSTSSSTSSYHRETTDWLSSLPVIIRHGTIHVGVLSKADVGGSQFGIPWNLINNYGALIWGRWTEVMNWILNQWMSAYGITLESSEYQWDDLEESLAFKQRLVDQLNRIAMMPAHTHYNIVRPDAMERRLMTVQSRVFELLGKRLIRDIKSKPLGGFRVAIESGAKGSYPHAIQLGACQGSQYSTQTLRMVASGDTHFCETIHLPYAHGFITSAIGEIGHPRHKYDQSVTGRSQAQRSYSNISLSGYLERRLITCLSVFTVHMDRTVRDSNGIICQFLYGENGMTMTHMNELDQFRFVTPDRFADRELKRLRTQLIQRWCMNHQRIELSPRAMVLPTLVLPILFGAQHLRSTSPSPTLPTLPISAMVLTRADVNTIREAWFTDLFRRIPHLLQTNLLIQVVLRDALSAYHICEVLRLTRSGFLSALQCLMDQLLHAVVPPGLNVGTIAGQHTAEPRTQTNFGTIKALHQRSSNPLLDQTQVLSPALAMSSAPLPEENLNYILNASKRESCHSMILTLRPPYCHQPESIRLACELLVNRPLWSLVTSQTRFGRGQHRQWPDEWARQRLQYQSSAIQDSVMRGAPTLRLVMDRALCKRLQLSLCQIAHDIQVALRATSLDSCMILFRGDLDPATEYVLYLHLNVLDHTSIKQSLTRAADKRNEPLDIMTITELQFQRALYITIRGIPQISMATPIQVTSYQPDPTDGSKLPIATTQFAIKVMGSNLQSAMMYPWIDPTGCKTTHAHEVHRMFGLIATRTSSYEAIDTQIRAQSKLGAHHMLLMSNAMNYRLHHMPFTRAGLRQLTNATFHQIGFEEVHKILYDAALKSHVDPLTNVMSAAMVGNRPHVGTAFCIDVVPADPKLQHSNVSLVPSLPSIRSSAPSPPPPASLSRPLPLPSSRLTDEQRYEQLCKHPKRTVPVHPMSWPMLQFYTGEWSSGSSPSLSNGSTVSTTATTTATPHVVPNWEALMRSSNHVRSRASSRPYLLFGDEPNSTVHRDVGLDRDPNPIARPRDETLADALLTRTGLMLLTPSFLWLELEC